MIATTNKSTRVTRKSASATDRILTNTIVNLTVETAIIKRDMSDHFQICFSALVGKSTTNSRRQ